MSQQCMRVFQLCDTISLSGRPIIGQLGIDITDPSVAILTNKTTSFCILRGATFIQDHGPLLRTGPKLLRL